VETLEYSDNPANPQESICGRFSRHGTRNRDILFRLTVQPAHCPSSTKEADACGALVPRSGGRRSIVV